MSAAAATATVTTATATTTVTKRSAHRAKKRMNLAALSPKSKLEAVLTALLAAYLSFSLVMGYKVSILQSCSIGPKSAIGLACVAVLAYAALMALWHAAGFACRQKDACRKQGARRLTAQGSARDPRRVRPTVRVAAGFTESKRRSRNRCLIAFFVILLAWLPYLFAGWPGYFTYDSGNGYLMQWEQIEDGQLNSHHPILHTLFLEVTIKAGMALFGSFNVGVALSVSVQAVLIAAVFALVLRWVQSLGIGRVGFWATVAYLALDPIIALFAFCTTKDSLFSAVVLLYCVSLFNVIRAAFAQPDKRAAASRPGTGVRRLDWRELLTFTLLTALMAVLRRNALVALFLIVPIVAILLRRRCWKRFVAASLAGLLLAGFWLGPFSMLLGVGKSPIGKWNGLCVAEQQIARCGVSDEVSAEDKGRIEAELPGISYRANLSDVARVAFEGKQCSAELVSLYIHLGISYPGIYTEAFLYQTEDAWSLFATVGKFYGSNDDETDVFMLDQQSPATRETLCEPLLEWVNWIGSSKEAAQTPLLGFLLSIAFYVAVALVCFVQTMRTRNTAATAFFVPLLVLALSCIFGPCMLIRYFLYLFFALPAMLYVSFGPRAVHPPAPRRCPEKMP